VVDAAGVLDVYAGYDQNDELTAFSVGRMPSKPYQRFTKVAKKEPLRKVRIGVVREYMDKDLFTVADSETIDIIDIAINDLRALELLSLTQAHMEPCFRTASISTFQCGVTNVLPASSPNSSQWTHWLTTFHS
jgi:Asp-tRNA(Asn)/Glu-tRNA(Gln) amidotransferase A subunit family amidase